jgi:hypothetical protein
MLVYAHLLFMLVCEYLIFHEIISVGINYCDSVLLNIYIILRRRLNMGFLSGLFGPGYKMDCIQTMTDKKALAELAANDVDAGVREAAKKRLEALK